QGITIHFYAIKGRYFSNYQPLRKQIKSNNYDIIHAHYSLSGILASLTTNKPVVVSLMSSLENKNLRYYIIKFFIRFIWSKTIVKSKKAALNLKNKSLEVIPNGIDLSLYQNLDKTRLRKKLNLRAEKKYVIFVANPNRQVKNFPLTENAFRLLNRKNVELLTVYNKTHQEVIEYMIAADALILTSLSEGSPNVIKEALACNLPIVTTNVGDVRWLLQNVKGTYISNSFDENEIAKLLQQALSFEGTVNGKEKLIQLQLDSITISQRIIELYKPLLHDYKD
ncbi:MAG: glycosyltransferase, partial [Bacteroidales bacterium]|nr:glycosyltransferase [Bacteroidales bacterium]